MAKAKRPPESGCRRLVVVLGDQLDADSSAFDGFDRGRDVVWMAEVAEESTRVWSHKARIALFLSAMRHFARRLREGGATVRYRELDAPGNRGGFSAELELAVEQLRPRSIVVTLPGEWRVLEQLRQSADRMGVELEVRPDRHFFSTPEEFAEHARGRKQLRQEYFYRELRRRHRVLMEGDKPVGGKWNYDADNRGSFGKRGPSSLPGVKRFEPDPITAGVLELVETRFGDHPGRLDAFDWPVTPEQAAEALDDFIDHRLADFGLYQDAMWTDEPYLYHSRVSAALNLKLLDPRIVVARATAAYETGAAPLSSVEGFVRQVLGWREYVRGVYWMHMPEYLDRNALGAEQPLPDFYWTGEVEMRCLRQAIGQTLDHGYAHHIQRLMVTGLFALLLGVDPKRVHEWYLAVYVDAVEWVELPNSLGMSQYADGGVMASKPYVATGKYLQRMSNYCGGCRYHPAKAVGEEACPFTTLYWDFLARHEGSLRTNQRMTMQLRNLDRKDPEELAAIRRQAREFRESLAANGTGTA